MYKSCELHLHSVKHKYLCCSILLWKTDLIHYILRIIAAPYRKIKCTADSCGHLFCKKTILLNVSRCWHWKSCFFYGLRESVADLYTFPLQHKSEQKGESAHTILSEYPQLHCVIWPWLTKAFKTMLNFNHKHSTIDFSSQVPSTSCSFSSDWRIIITGQALLEGVEKIISFIKIRGFNLVPNKIQKELLSVCTNSTMLFTISLFRAEPHLFALSSCSSLFLYYPPICKAFHS